MNFSQCTGLARRGERRGVRRGRREPVHPPLPQCGVVPEPRPHPGCGPGPGSCGTGSPSTSSPGRVAAAGRRGHLAGVGPRRSPAGPGRGASPRAGRSSSTGPDLDAQAAAVAIETIEIAHHGLKLEELFWMPVVIREIVTEVARHRRAGRGRRGVDHRGTRTRADEELERVVRRCTERVARDTPAGVGPVILDTAQLTKLTIDALLRREVPDRAGSAWQALLNPTRALASPARTSTTRPSPPGPSAPQQSYAGGEPDQLTLDLFFDGTGVLGSPSRCLSASSALLAPHRVPGREAPALLRCTPAGGGSASAGCSPRPTSPTRCSTATASRCAPRSRLTLKEVQAPEEVRRRGTARLTRPLPDLAGLRRRPDRPHRRQGVRRPEVVASARSGQPAGQPAGPRGRIGPSPPADGEGVSRARQAQPGQRPDFELRIGGSAVEPRLARTSSRSTCSEEVEPARPVHPPGAELGRRPT